MTDSAHEERNSRPHKGRNRKRRGRRRAHRLPTSPQPNAPETTGARRRVCRTQPRHRRQPKAKLRPLRRAQSRNATPTPPQQAAKPTPPTPQPTRQRPRTSINSSLPPRTPRTPSWQSAQPASTRRLHAWSAWECPPRMRRETWSTRGTSSSTPPRIPAPRTCTVCSRRTSPVRPASASFRRSWPTHWMGGRWLLMMRRWSGVLSSLRPRGHVVRRIESAAPAISAGGGAARGRARAVFRRDQGGRYAGDRAPPGHRAG